MNNDRLLHSIAVARKMVEIAKEKKLSIDDQNNCFVIGYNHDIGYEFTINGYNHGIIAGEILKKQGFKYWKEIYYHGMIDPKYNSIYLDILNMADMQIDKHGNDVGYDERLKDISSRYGIDSEIYKSCKQMIELLQKKI